MLGPPTSNLKRPKVPFPTISTYRTERKNPLERNDFLGTIGSGLRHLTLFCASVQVLSMAGGSGDQGALRFSRGPKATERRRPVQPRIAAGNRSLTNLGLCSLGLRLRFMGVAEAPSDNL